MSSYYGTDGNDFIDARELSEEYDVIDAMGGDDTVYLRNWQTYAAGEGADTVIGSGESDYALWSSPGSVYINLEEGYAQDGFGEIDSLSGIKTIHMSNYGGTVIGSERDERIFCFGDDSFFDLGLGNDIVTMHQQDSSEYTIRLIDDVWYLTGSESQVEMRGVEIVEFDDQSYVAPASGFIYKQPHTAYSFIETEWSEGWWYAGVYNEPSLVEFFIQAPQPMDIGADGDLDYVFPVSRGYRSGVDTRAHFIVLENDEGQLVYNETMTLETPFIAGSRRSDTIFLESLNTEAIVSIAHDTAIETETRYDIPWRLGDIVFLAADPFLDVTDQVVPKGTLPDFFLTGRDTAVDAHSMAVGDINNDGLDDVLIGELSADPFALLQTESGLFDYQTTDFFSSLLVWVEPTLSDATSAMLLDLHLEDFNGDGADDLIAGWGHGTVLSRVFFNDGNGDFSLDNSSTLPVSLYGHDNALHMKTFSEDFDLDGDQDLLILNTRNEPYYGGSYIQFLENDGLGGFTDATTKRLGNPEFLGDTFGERLEWIDYWQTFDTNGDGAIDIVGRTVAGTPILYLNDGVGDFTKIEYPSLPFGRPMIFGDFDSDLQLDVVTFENFADEARTSSQTQLTVYESQTVNLDTARAYDLEGHAGEVAKTLGAVFGAGSVFNEAYAGIGLRLLDDGMSYEALMQLAIDARLGIGVSHEEVVDLLYTNVVGTAPSESAKSQFVDYLDDGIYSVASLGVMAADTDLNQENIDIMGLAQTGLEYIFDA